MEKDEKRPGRRGFSSLLKGTALASALRLGGTALGFLFNILLARWEGAAGSGHVIFLMTLATTAGTLATLGTEVRAMRTVAEAGDDALDAPVRNEVVTAIAVTVLASLLMAPLMMALVFLEADSRSVATAVDGGMVALAVLFVGIGKICSDILTARGLVLPAQAAFSAIPRGINAGAYALSKPLLGLGWGMVSFLLAQAVAAVYALSRMSRVLQRGWMKLPPLADQWRAVVSARSLFFASIFWTLMNVSPIFSLGFLGSREEVGIFGICWRLMLAISLILSSLHQLSFRELAQAEGQGGRAAESSFNNAVRVGLLMTGPFLLCALVFTGPVLALFGPEFEQSGQWPLRILVVAYLVVAACGPAGAALVMKQQEAYYRNTVMVAALASVAGNVVLDAKFGAVGAALATALALSGQALALRLRVRSLYRSA